LRDNGRIPPINQNSNHTKNNQSALQGSQSYVQTFGAGNNDINNQNFQINLQGVGQYGPNEIPNSLS